MGSSPLTLHGWALSSGPIHPVVLGQPIAWRGETDASGLHGWGLAVALARMLLTSVPMGWPNTIRWRVPLVKARTCKVKELDPVVKRYRVRQDGGPGGSNATGASHRALIHAVRCGGMSEEAARVSGVWPPHGRR